MGSGGREPVGAAPCVGWAHVPPKLSEGAEARMGAARLSAPTNSLTSKLLRFPHDLRGVAWTASAISTYEDIHGWPPASHSELIELVISDDRIRPPLGSSV